MPIRRFDDYSFTAKIVQEDGKARMIQTPEEKSAFARALKAHQDRIVKMIDKHTEEIVLDVFNRTKAATPKHHSPFDNGEVIDAEFTVGGDNANRRSNQHQEPEEAAEA